MFHTNIQIYTLCVHPASRTTFCYQGTGRHTASPSNSTTAPRRRSIAMAAVAAVAGDVFRCAKESWNGSLISPHGCTIRWPIGPRDASWEILRGDLQPNDCSGAVPQLSVMSCGNSLLGYVHLRSAQKQQYSSCPNEFTCEQEVERFG